MDTLIKKIIINNQKTKTKNEKKKNIYNSI